MNRRILFGALAMLVAGATPAFAQSGRRATLPPPPQPAAPDARTDGSMLVNFGQGQWLVRSCTAYRAGIWPGGQPRGRNADPAPQGGSASRPPGANGLPPAPGLSPVPGAVSAGRREPGRSTSSLRPLHSGWRTAGPAYYDAACYVYDRDGRLHLIPL